MKGLKFTFCIALLFLFTNMPELRAQTDEGGQNTSYAEVQKQLASRDPLLRQRAAEELAQLADPANRKLLEGYRLQEKNARVKLALDWALYRIGKTSLLFSVIDALDSTRAEQASAYLSKLDAPDPLYYFLERMNGNTQVKLLGVLGKIGDTTTLEKIKPHHQSADPKIAEAAQLATSEIESRLGQSPANTQTRPRQVGSSEAEPD